jgi:putative phosphoesterase
LKKILLLSDTHGFVDDKMLHYAALADETWHAGDWGPQVHEKLIAHTPLLRGVYGNIDNQSCRQLYPKHLYFTCEGLKVYITHIGGYPGRYSLGVKDKIMQQHSGLFISGHSHILKVMRDAGLKLIHMNPGAAGIHGFHKVRTWLTFEVNNGIVQNLNVIECPKIIEHASKNE